MNKTPNLNSANGAAINGKTTTPANGQPVALSEVLTKVKEQTALNDKAEQEPTPPAEPTKPEAATEPKPAAPATPPATDRPERSRENEISFQIEKSRKMQLINTQLQNLKGKYNELKAFSYNVDKDDNHQYGRLSIFDDSNREFTCNNHGLAEIVVEELKTKFAAKIQEKEDELLTVSRS